MSVKKAELNLPSGETIRVCIWDPKTSLLPKEQGTIVRQFLKAKQKKAQGGYLSRLLSGNAFTYYSSDDEDAESSSTDSEDEAATPVPSELGGG